MGSTRRNWGCSLRRSFRWCWFLGQICGSWPPVWSGTWEASSTGSCNGSLGGIWGRGKRIYGSILGWRQQWRTQDFRRSGLHHEEAEYGCAIYCDATDSGPLWTIFSEDGSLGFLVVVGAGGNYSRGVGGESGCRIGRRGEEMRRWSDAEKYSGP